MFECHIEKLAEQDSGPVAEYKEKWRDVFSQQQAGQEPVQAAVFSTNQPQVAEMT